MNLRLTKILSILAVALVLGWVGAISAQAEVIDFAGGTGGTVSYATTGGDLTGSGIPISSVEGSFVPLNNLVTLNSPDAVLSFTTGALTGTTASTWSFGAGGAGSITIKGDLYNGPDIPANLVATGTLLSGAINSALASAIPGTGFKLIVSPFKDAKNEALLDFYGAIGPFVGLMAITVNDSSVLPPGTFTGTPVSTDVSNVPLPSSMLLLSSGLVGLLALGQRIRKR